MKKIIIFLSIIIIATGLIFFVRSKYYFPKNPSNIQEENILLPISDDRPLPEITSLPAQKTLEFKPPLDRAKERVTKKYFGLFVAPQNSPVQPEKFRGYHTGTDFEIFPEEADAIVSVHAICSGKLLVKKYATGYGGAAVQACVLDNQPVTVIYGHLKLASITNNVGDELKTGEAIGPLGATYSQETSGERKHLHLGIHKGSGVNILGYVQSKNELSGWIDPCLYICD
jgi:hypothetical protein